MGILNPYTLLKFSKMLNSHRLKCAAVLIADFFNARYMSIRMDPALGCNLRCKMCHFSSEEKRGAAIKSFSLSEYERIAHLFFKKSIQVILGTAAEPTLHPLLPDLVKVAKKKYKVPFVGISSNGQKLTREIIIDLLNNGLDEIMISMHGVKKETYEWFQPPASYEKLHVVLEMLTQIAHTKNYSFSVRVNYTVNPDNLEELSEFFDVFGKYKIDILQVRKIFDLGETVYTNRNLESQWSLFETICMKLKKHCMHRKTVLLFPAFAASSSKLASPAVLLPLVMRYVSPEEVWKKDFNWQTETYEEYCRRTKWRKRIAQMIFMKEEMIIKNIENADRSLGYDVSG